MSDRFTLTVHNRCLFSQRARSSDAGLPFAESAPVAADMLISGVNSVQVIDDLELVRQVKADLRQADQID